MKWLAVVIGISGAVAGSIVMASASPNRGEVPEYGLDLGKGQAPRYVAVSDGRGGVAGYAELALMQGTDVVTAEQQRARSAAVGIVIPVYDTAANIVGYFPSQPSDFVISGGSTSDELVIRPDGNRGLDALPSGFVSAEVRDELVDAGFLYVAGSKPIPAADGSSEGGR